MAMNMDAILRIKAAVSGVSDVRQMQNSLEGIRKSAGETTKELRKTREEAQSWRDSALKIAAVGASLTVAAKAAIDFESSVADVRKVVSGLETPQALGDIRQEILELSRQMPITAAGFAEIYAAAGQSGIARGELQEFAVMVGKVATAFDMTAADAGQSLAQMKVALGLTNKEVGELADSMNYLSNNTGSTAANLVEFISRAGAAGKIAGLSGQETAAFGAAMIQAGVQTEVAATSFNIMLKALSAGTNMTERQTTALERLGYAYQPAVVATRDYTREAEAQSRDRLATARDESDQRLEILRNETDRMTREIDRRYRQIKQQLEDQWEDERDARDQAMAQASRQASKAMQREQQREQQALNDRYDELLKRETARLEGRTDAMVDAEREAIRKRNRDARQQEMQALEDRYESRREALDQQQREEQKMLRRADRDKQQQVIDGLQSRQEAEDAAARSQLNEAEKIESKIIATLEESEKLKIEVIRQNQKEIEAEQKKQAEALADAWKLSFAERLQKDGSTFLTEILGKIATLPKGEQLSVLTGLFGEEARGLAPLLGNLNELQRVLGLAADRTAAAGSVSREFEERARTVANQMVIFTNSVNELKIAFGDALLPVINAILPGLTGLFTALANITKATQGLITFIAQAVGLKIVLSPAIAAVALLASTIGGIFSLVTLARWGAALKILAFLPGPLRLVAAAFGVITLAASPLGPIINAIVIGITAIQAIKFAGGVLAGIKTITGAFLGFLGFLKVTIAPFLIAFFSGPAGWTVLAVAAVVAMAIAFRKPIGDFLQWLPGAFSSAWSTITNAIARTWSGLVQSMSNAFNGFLQGIRNSINAVSGQVNRLIRAFNSLPGPDISQIPQFAQGGFVTRPTLAMIGEGGEPEYVVPRSKAMTFANNIVSGRRGNQALSAPPGRAMAGSTAGSSFTPLGPSGPIAINIQTGPVVEMNGQRYVSYDDLERAMRVTADGVIGRLRTPYARQALGR
jgi:hypothetical protein